jgi:hypothetical protein
VATTRSRILTLTATDHEGTSMSLPMPPITGALLVSVLLLATASPAAAAAEQAEPPPSISAFTEGDRHLPGFLDLYWSADDGKVRIAVPTGGRDALYVNYLAAGIGSNDIGLDRGQIGNTRFVRFEVRADRVLIVQPNLDYRAGSDNPDERRAVDEAFATSVLAALPVVARDDDRVLADLTELAITDVHGVADRLASTGQGSYQPDTARSAVIGEALAAFPRNTIVESLLTLTGTDTGDYLDSVTPSSEAVSVRIRHEFIAPPPDGFRRRQYHPRSGGFARRYIDYAVPLSAPLEQRMVVRHRLERDSSTGRTVEPIVYYVDRGAPEPIRSALLEGASWWSEAFAAAGFPDGFRVELLPEGVSPLDIRYNVIQWVHRATRGWSYGWGVIDPRTGEIIKGHVTLGSQRVRQDQLIGEALTAPFGASGDGGQAARALALARLRQLAAHEVGHTLGLAHNFAASTQQNASVMDYPHPYVRLDGDGNVDLSAAYSTSIGSWDRHAISYLYTPFEPQREAAGLRAILARGANLVYLSDADARSPATGATSLGHVWDNGEDAIARFDELMAVRERALQGFSSAVLREDAQLYEAEARLVPVYLLHRYQFGAVVKLIGGADYAYGLRGERPATPTPVPAARQQAALDALLAALSPDALKLDRNVLAVMGPPGPESDRSREYFTHHSGRLFDPLAPARAAAQLGAQLLLDPTRAQRLLNQHMLDEELPGLTGYLDRITGELVRIDVTEDYTGMVTREVAWTVVHELQRLSIDDAASQPVRTAARHALATVLDWAERNSDPYSRRLHAMLAEFLEEPDAELIGPRHPVPPGSPI